MTKLDCTVTTCVHNGEVLLQERHPVGGSTGEELL